MLARLVATILCLNAACLAFAGPYLVQFEGAITEVADEAPDTFWIGERVAGAFVYDPDAPIAYGITTWFQLVDTSPLVNAGNIPSWLDTYSGFPGNERRFFFTQVWRGGDLAVASEGGFYAHDDALDFLWIGTTPSSEGIIYASSGNHVFHVGNSGHWMNRVLGEPRIPSTLTTTSGPQATALQIDFAEASPELVFDDQGLLKATLTQPREPADADAARRRLFVRSTTTRFR